MKDALYLICFKRSFIHANVQSKYWRYFVL